MSPRSCFATVSINFCLSRSFLRNCANMLFLRLVSFILNREGEKDSECLRRRWWKGAGTHCHPGPTVRNIPTARLIPTCSTGSCPAGTQSCQSHSPLGTVKSRSGGANPLLVHTCPTYFIPSISRRAPVVGGTQDTLQHDGQKALTEPWPGGSAGWPSPVHQKVAARSLVGP